MICRCVIYGGNPGFVQQRRETEFGTLIEYVPCPDCGGCGFEPEPSERDRDLAVQISREVAEMPDRTSPDDEPDIMFVIQDEIEQIARVYLAAARAEGRREAIEECAQIAGELETHADGVHAQVCREIAAAIRMLLTEPGDD